MRRLRLLALLAAAPLAALGPPRPASAQTEQPADPRRDSAKSFWEAHVARVNGFDLAAWEDFGAEGRVLVRAVNLVGESVEREMPVAQLKEFEMAQALTTTAADRDDRYAYTRPVLAAQADGYTVRATARGLETCMDHDYAATIVPNGEGWRMAYETLLLYQGTECAPDAERARTLLVRAKSRYATPRPIEPGLVLLRADVAELALTWVFQTKLSAKAWEKQAPVMESGLAVMACSEGPSRQVVHHGGTARLRVLGKNDVVLVDRALGADDCP